MKYLLIIFFLFVSSYSFSQDYTEKYNSILSRYEYFDSKGNLKAFRKYNSVLKQWEYTDVTSSQNKRNSNIYEDVTIYEPDLEMINTVLANKEARSNSRRQEVDHLIRSIADKLRDKYSYDPEIRNRASSHFQNVFGDKLKMITSRDGTIDIHNNRIFSRLHSILSSSYNETVQFIEKQQEEARVRAKRKQEEARIRAKRKKEDARIKKEKDEQRKLREIHEEEKAIKYLNAGHQLRDDGENIKAISYYKLALSTNPTLEEAYYNIGLLQFEQVNAISDDMEDLGLDLKGEIEWTQLRLKKLQILNDIHANFEKAQELKPSHTKFREAINDLQNYLDKLSTTRTGEEIIQPEAPVLGGFRASKIYEYDLDEEGRWKQTAEIDMGVKVFFANGEYYFKRGTQNWKTNLWTYIGYDEKNEVYLYYDSFGATIEITKDTRMISWFTSKDENAMPRKVIIYGPLERDNTIQPYD